eukprot:11741231-Heterocapsa_arctica.AAC.1
MDWSSHGLGDDLSDTQPASLSFASIDLVDSFYQFYYPEAASYFCFQLRVRAGQFGVTSIWDDDLGCQVEVSEDDMVYPAFAGLPMGWSWAPYLRHSALCDAMSVSEAR